MLSMSEYLYNIVPLVVTYFAVWFGFKMWKAGQKKTSAQIKTNSEGGDKFSQALNFMGGQKGLSNEERLMAYAIYKQVS